MSDWQTAVLNFARAVQHGDDVHRAWLLEAAQRFVSGEPLPPPRDAKTAAPALSANSAEEGGAGLAARSSAVGERDPVVTQDSTGSVTSAKHLDPRPSTEGSIRSEQRS